jgi:hypothetical protein
VYGGADQESSNNVAGTPHMKGNNMSRRALVFLQRRGSEGESYIGPKLVDPAPILGSRVIFLHDGVTLAGRVGNIQPATWSNNSEIVPTIRVLQD